MKIVILNSDSLVCAFLVARVKLARTLNESMSPRLVSAVFAGATK